MPDASNISRSNRVFGDLGGGPSSRMYFGAFKSFAGFTTLIMIYLPFSDAFWWNWLVTFEVIGSVDRWYHQETGHRCSAELGRGERGCFPLLDFLHLVLKWKMLLYHKSTSTPLADLTKSYYIGVSMLFAKRSALNCYIPCDYLKCLQSTLFLPRISHVVFVKNISQEQFCFLTPKIPCFWPTLGTFFHRHSWQAHKRAIQAAAPGDLAALGLKLWIFSRLTGKGKPFIESYAGWLGGVIWILHLSNGRRTHQVIKQIFNTCSTCIDIFFVG